MRIKFIDGQRSWLYYGNAIEYINNKTLHTVKGCFVHPGTKGEHYKKIYFRYTKKELKHNTIYIVRQKNKIDQFHTLIHELCHWLVSKIGNSEKLHSLIEKYIH